MLVTSEEGHYYYKATSDDTTVCGIYLMSPPNRIIEVYFDYLDAPCGSGGLVSVIVCIYMLTFYKISIN